MPASLHIVLFNTYLQALPATAAGGPYNLQFTSDDGGSAALNDVLGWLMLAGVSAFAVARFSTAHLALQFAGLTLFALYLLGVLGAMAVAFAIKRTFMRGDYHPLMLELPEYSSAWPPRTVSMVASRSGSVSMR